MKLALKIVGVLVLLLVLVAGAGYAWASTTTNKLRDRVVELHTVDFPIPFPLDGEEVADGVLEPDEAHELALARAVERGEHLVKARYGCIECHGADFGGGVMMDAPIIGRAFGPNLTSGEGGVTSGWEANDWDRIVRHGVRSDMRPSHMPSEDFERMSDQELSDIIAYVRSLPPVHNEMPQTVIGPIGKFLIATGEIVMAYDRMAPHDGEHTAMPPAAEVSVAFGRHLANVCVGCHRADFAGGTMAGGDPTWVPARNLTPHEDGLAGWTYEQFAAVMLAGTRPDGTRIQAPMDALTTYARNMTEVELRALWLFLQSLPPVASRE